MDGAGIANMEDPHVIATDFIIDVVRMTDDCQLMDTRLIRLRCKARKIGENRDAPLDYRLH
jgi:hypothetical protein